MLVTQPLGWGGLDGVGVMGEKGVWDLQAAECEGEC